VTSGSFDADQYWEARLARDYDLKGVGFRRLGARYNAWLYRLRADAFRAAFAASRLDAASTRALDVGAGTGFWIDQWWALGTRMVTACDLTTTAVESLRARYRDVPVQQVDIGAVDGARGLAGSEFDAVTVMDVLQHLVDDAAFRRALGHLAALVRPGGVVFITDNFVRVARRQARQHHVSRPYAAWQEALSEAGFVIEALRPVSVLLGGRADGGPVSRGLFLGVSAAASLAEPVGGAIGAALYPAERFVVSHRTTTGSQKLMSCRRVDVSPRG
jgi:2-polyprenyl-3-methyl-5-hydroxy-6-metoxy-1,4-benzoquinol methylase